MKQEVNGIIGYWKSQIIPRHGCTNILEAGWAPETSVRCTSLSKPKQLSICNIHFFSTVSIKAVGSHFSFRHYCESLPEWPKIYVICQFIPAAYVMITKRPKKLGSIFCFKKQSEKEMSPNLQTEEVTIWFSLPILQTDGQKYKYFRLSWFEELLWKTAPPRSLEWRQTEPSLWIHSGHEISVRAQCIFVSRLESYCWYFQSSRLVVRILRPDSYAMLYSQLGLYMLKHSMQLCSKTQQRRFLTNVLHSSQKALVVGWTTC